MTTLTNSMRDSILSRAISEAFAVREKVIAGAEEALAIKCYKAVMPADEIKAAKAMKPGWIRQDRCLRFNAGGYSVNLCMRSREGEEDRGLPVKYSNSCNQIGAVTGELAAEVQKFSHAKEQMKTEREQARNKMRAFLYSFTTINKIKEAWPEGKKFYGMFDVERKKDNLPAIVTKEINAMLGLKSTK